MKIEIELPIKSYTDQLCDHMVRNGMWCVFYLPVPRNKDRNWEIILDHCWFISNYTKRHVKTLWKVLKADQDVVQKLKWSGVYLMSTLSNYFLQKLLTVVMLTATVLDLYVSTMTIFMSYNYNDLEETLTHMKNLKLNISQGRMLNMSVLISCYIRSRT